MKKMLLILLAQIILVPFVNAADINGEYSLKIIGGMNSSTLNMTCKEDSGCTLNTVTITNGKTETTSLLWPKPIPQENLKQAQLSLKYAKDHLPLDESSAPDDVVFKMLKPIFDANAHLSECLDLDGRAGYLLCSLSSNSDKLPTILFMSASLSGCGPTFCGYQIYPLSRSSVASPISANSTKSKGSENPRFYYAFSFDARESPDVEILDFLYGDTNGYSIKNPPYFVHQNKCAQSENVHAQMPVPEELYVKWRLKSTGQEYEDKVLLGKLMPEDMTNYRVHFIINGAQLNVYLITPERRQGDTQPIGPKAFSYLKTLIIYSTPTN